MMNTQSEKSETSGGSAAECRGTTLDRVARGVIAGAAGGLVGAGAKLVGEAIFPPRMPGEQVPPAVMVSRLVRWLSGSPLLQNKEMIATQAFHWTFSVAAGATYGALVEVFPRAKIGRGVGFGLVLFLMTHESLLPLLGFSIPFGDMPLKEHLSELLTHSVYGFCVEAVRRLMRRRVVTAYPEAVARPLAFIAPLRWERAASTRSPGRGDARGPAR
jgi:putative membrane protein